MLWKQLQQDAFQTDIIEIVREYDPLARKLLRNYSRDDFSEVYLFFDYDGHQGNLGQAEGVSGDEVLKAMLQAFDNETDQGKLYVSYPMAEALRDYIPGRCANLTGCFFLLISSESISSRVLIMQRVVIFQSILLKTGRISVLFSA